MVYLCGRSTYIALMPSNRDLWLILLMKKGTLTFQDIKEAVDRISGGGCRLGEIFDIGLPEAVAGQALEYGQGGRHALFHHVLGDLDALVMEGLAARSLVKVGRDELEECFVITPRGVGRVGALIAGMQSGGFHGRE